jgi:RimJ/RimL family protein N-acetyltransferase
VTHYGKKTEKAVNTGWASAESRMDSLAAVFHRLRREYSRLRREYSEVGFTTTVESVVYQLLRVRSFYLIERELDPKANVAPNIRAAVIPDDLNILLSRGAPKQYFPQRILQGEFAFAYDDGQGPKGLLWISSAYFETYDYDWLRVTMGEGDINGRYLWIDPSCRGHGISPKMNIAIDAVSCAAGYVRIVNIVNALNKRAQKADRKIGYRRLAHIIRSNYLGLCLVRTKRGAAFGRFDRENPLLIKLDDLR